MPLALFISTALVRVQAAAGTQSPSSAPAAAPAAQATPALPAAPQLDDLQNTPPADAIQLDDRALGGQALPAIACNNSNGFGGPFLS